MQRQGASTGTLKKNLFFYYVKPRVVLFLASLPAFYFLKTKARSDPKMVPKPEVFHTGTGIDLVYR
jgi:hypothetical protein